MDAEAESRVRAQAAGGSVTSEEEEEEEGEGGVESGTELFNESEGEGEEVLEVGYHPTAKEGEEEEEEGQEPIFASLVTAPSGKQPASAHLAEVLREE